MTNTCECNSVSEFPPFRYQSTSTEPPTGFQVETSQKNIEDYLNRLKTAIEADMDCLCTKIQELESRVEALEP